MKRRLSVLVVSTFVTAYACRAAAEPPCLQLVLPEAFAGSEDWSAHVARETAQLGELDATGARVGCTLITLQRAEDTLLATVQRGALQEQTELALDDVPEAQRARVAALVIGDMVRALAERPDPPASPEPVQARDRSSRRSSRSRSLPPNARVRSLFRGGWARARSRWQPPAWRAASSRAPSQRLAPRGCGSARAHTASSRAARRSLAT